MQQHQEDEMGEPHRGGLKILRFGGLDDQAYDLAGSKLEIGWQQNFHWQSNLWSG